MNHCWLSLRGLSIGAGGLGALLALGEPIAFGLAAVGVVLAAVALRRRSGKRQASCAGTGACSIDGACGCRAPDARALHGVSDGPTPPPAPPPRPTA
ncbi:hypothetical protein [Sorangium sp. So ce513]|uniref:hypothetical protein n=1 Tax=Sorangium sp. So ce513 TaxID=3133315 RepID=UPI003F5E2445